LKTIDTILIGRVTYDWIMKHENEFPYKGKECYVFSKEKRDNNKDVTFIHNNIIGFINQLKTKNGGKIWLVGGSKLVSELINTNLVDELIIQIVPVLIGDGIPLFKKKNNQTKFTLKSINRYNQFVELNYELLNN